MVRSFQYPAVVSPVPLGAAEVTTPDKWMGSEGQNPAPRARGRLAECYQSFGAEAFSQTLPESVTADRWARNAEPDPGRKRGTASWQHDGPDPVQFSAFTLFPDRWAPQPPPPRPAPRLADRDAFDNGGPTTFLERVSEDKWHCPPPEPVRPRPRAAELFPALALDAQALTAPERATPDKWQPATALPARPARKLSDSLGDSALVQLVAPAILSQVSGFFQNLELPARNRSRPPTWLSDEGLALGVFTLERVSADRWHAQARDPARTPPRAQPGDGPLVQLVTAAGPTFPGWLPAPGDPPRRARTPPAGEWQGALGVFNLEAVSADRWLSPPPHPARPAARAPGASGPLVQLVSSGVTFPGWHAPAESPARKARAPHGEGVTPLGVFTAEDVTALRWHPAPNLPCRPLRGVPSFLTDRTGQPAAFAPERVSPDRWFSRNAEPARPPQRRAPAHDCYLPHKATLPAELVTLDKWWRAAEFPLHRLARFHHGGLTPAQTYVLVVARRGAAVLGYDDLVNASGVVGYDDLVSPSGLVGRDDGVNPSGPTGAY